MPVARAGMVQMPAPGTMVNLTPAFTPAHLMGIVIDPKNALKFDFLIHKGEVPLSDTQKREEYRDLIKYFLASLTIPNDNQWVNLSPYEGQRMIRDDFGKTGMGRDLLAQDYILKQLTASLMHPDSELGKKFWARVYEQVYQKYGTTEVPVDTFNKVWVTADDASVYEKDNTAIVVNSHLKIMTERDYVATANDALTREMGQAPAMTEPSKISAEIVKEIIIPAIEKEVNEGKTFANLRQIYSSMILAVWFKKQLRESVLGKAYADHSAVKGVDQDPKNNEAIYQQYLEAYKKGVFNMIKEDVDRYTQEVLPRKYFSGGARVAQVHDAPAADAEKLIRPVVERNELEKVGTAFTMEVKNQDAGPDGAAGQDLKEINRVRTILNDAVNSGVLDLSAWGNGLAYSFTKSMAQTFDPKNTGRLPENFSEKAVTDQKFQRLTDQYARELSTVLAGQLGGDPKGVQAQVVKEEGRSINAFRTSSDYEYTVGRAILLNGIHVASLKFGTHERGGTRYFIDLVKPVEVLSDTLDGARRMLQSLGIKPGMSFTYLSDDYQEAYKQKTVTLGTMSLADAQKWIKYAQAEAQRAEFILRNQDLLQKAKEKLQAEFNIKAGDHFQYTQNDYQEPGYGTEITVAFKNLNLFQAVTWIEQLGGKFTADMASTSAPVSDHAENKDAIKESRAKVAEFDDGRPIVDESFGLEKWNINKVMRQVMMLKDGGYGIRAVLDKVNEQFVDEYGPRQQFSQDLLVRILGVINRYTSGVSYELKGDRLTVSHKTVTAMSLQEARSKFASSRKIFIGGPSNVAEDYRDQLPLLRELLLQIKSEASARKQDVVIMTGTASWGIGRQVVKIAKELGLTTLSALPKQSLELASSDADHTVMMGQDWNSNRYYDEVSGFADSYFSFEGYQGSRREYQAFMEKRDHGKKAFRIRGDLSLGQNNIANHVALAFDPTAAVQEIETAAEWGKMAPEEARKLINEKYRGIAAMNEGGKLTSWQQHQRRQALLGTYDLINLDGSLNYKNYLQKIGSLKNDTKADWLAGYEFVSLFHDEVAYRVTDIELEQYASAVHNNGYWRENALHIRNEHPTSVEHLILGVAPEMSAGEQDEFFTEEGKVAYQDRFQKSSGYKILLSHIKQDHWLAFYMKFGAYKSQMDLKKLLFQDGHVNPNINPAKTQVFNANMGSYQDLEKDAVNFVNHAERLNVMKENQRAGIASAFSLLRIPSRLRFADMDYYTAVIWRYTGHWNGVYAYDGKDADGKYDPDDAKIEDPQEREAAARKRVVYQVSTDYNSHEFDQDRLKDGPVWRAVLDRWLELRKGLKPGERFGELLKMVTNDEKLSFISSYDTIIQVKTAEQALLAGEMKSAPEKIARLALVSHDLGYWPGVEADIHNKNKPALGRIPNLSGEQQQTFLSFLNEDGQKIYANRFKAASGYKFVVKHLKPEMRKPFFEFMQSLYGLDKAGVLASLDTLAGNAQIFNGNYGTWEDLKQDIPAFDAEIGPGLRLAQMMKNQEDNIIMTRLLKRMGDLTGQQMSHGMAILWRYVVGDYQGEWAYDGTDRTGRKDPEGWRNGSVQVGMDYYDPKFAIDRSRDYEMWSSLLMEMARTEGASENQALKDEVFSRASNESEAAWLSTYRPIVRRVEELERTISREQLEQFAPAVHDNGYLALELSHVNDPEHYLLGSHQQVTGRHIENYMTPEARDWWEHRNDPAYIEKFNAMPNEERTALAARAGVQRVGIKGYQFTDGIFQSLKSKTKFYVLSGKTEEAARSASGKVILNENVQNFKLELKDSDNYGINGEKRREALYNMQKGALATALVLADLDLDMETMAYLTAVIWRYKGHYDGEKGYQSVWQVSQDFLMGLDRGEREKDVRILMAVFALLGKKPKDTRFVVDGSVQKGDLDENGLPLDSDFKGLDLQVGDQGYLKIDGKWYSARVEDYMGDGFLDGRYDQEGQLGKKFWKVEGFMFRLDAPVAGVFTPSNGLFVRMSDIEKEKNLPLSDRRILKVETVEEPRVSPLDIEPDGAMTNEIEQKALRAARELILSYGGKPDYKGASQKEVIAQLVAASGYKGKDAKLFSKTVENVLNVERLISNEAAVEFVKTGVKAQANWVGDKIKGLTPKALSKFFETSLWPLAEILRKENFYQNFNETTWKAFQEFKNGNSDVEGLSLRDGVNTKVFQLLAAVDAMVQSIKAELNQNFSLQERMELAKLVHNNGYFLAEFARTRDPHDQLLPVEKNGSLKGNGADLLTPAARARYDARVGVTGRDSLVKFSLGDFVLATPEDRSKVLNYFAEIGKDVTTPMKNIDPKGDGVGISLEAALESGDEKLLSNTNVFNGFVQNWDGLLADFKGNDELFAKQEAFIYGKQVDAVAGTLVLLSLEKLFKQYLDAQVDANKEPEFLDVMNRATNAVWRATNPWESWSSPLIRQSYDEIGLDQKMKDERIWKAVILEFRVKLFRMSAAAQKDLSTQIRTLFKFLKSARSPIVKRQVITKTPEAYYNLMKKNGYIFVGTVTSSGLGISQEDIAPAKAAIKQTLRNIALASGVPMNKIVLVSGATGNEEAGNLSGVELSYQAAEEVGAMTMGITSTKAFSYPIKTPDFLLFKGMDWGNESDMLLMYADHMIGFTGGNQAASEMEQYINAQRGPVYLIQGVHSYLPNLKKTGSTTGTLDAPEVEMMVRGMGVEGSSVININAQPDGAMKIEIKQKALAAVKRYIQHNGGRPDRGDPSGDQVVAILVQQSRLTGQDLKDFRSMVDEFLNAQPVNTSHGLGYDYVLSTAGQVFQNRLFRVEEERKSVDVIEEEDNKAAITIINELKGDTFDVRISGDETALATAAERDFKQIVSLQIFRGTKSTEQAFVVGLAVRKALHYSEQLRQGDTVIYEFTLDAVENKKGQVVKNEKYGGIDFNEQYLKMNIKRDGNGVPLPIGQQDLDNIKIDGLVPVILNIQPVTSLPILSKASTADPAMG